MCLGAMEGLVMLNHPMCWDILAERPAEKADICSWMYIRNVLEDQRPCLWMVLQWTPLRCMAMAPPACREWLLMDEGGKPFWSSLVARTVAFRMWLISAAWRHCKPLLGAE